MRSATLMTMLAATLLLAACDASEETGTMPMASEDMPMEDTMSMDAEDMPMTQSGEAGRTASAEGTITAIDADAGTITIDHGAVPAVDWPAMTMAFEAGEALRSEVAVGDAVTFEFRTSDGGNEITAISER
ncbi:copper-binding protein [Pelagerythrobacter aerophilus]